MTNTLETNEPLGYHSAQLKDGCCVVGAFFVFFTVSRNHHRRRDATRTEIDEALERCWEPARVVPWYTAPTGALDADPFSTFAWMMVLSILTVDDNHEWPFARGGGNLDPPACQVDESACFFWLLSFAMSHTRLDGGNSAAARSRPCGVAPQMNFHVSAVAGLRVECVVSTSVAHEGGESASRVPDIC